MVNPDDLTDEEREAQLWALQVIQELCGLAAQLDTGECDVATFMRTRNERVREASERGIALEALRDFYWKRPGSREFVQ